MAQDLSNKYFVKRLSSGSWQDVTTLFDGIKILSISGFNAQGDAQNVFTQQWVDTQEEDYFLAGTKVIRSNVDLELTFIASSRYATGSNVDTQAAYDGFVEYICENGDFYIKSAYTNKYAHVVCLKGVKPTVEKLHRGNNSFIMATATLHTLDAPKDSQ